MRASDGRVIGKCGAWGGQRQALRPHAAVRQREPRHGPAPRKIDKVRRTEGCGRGDAPVLVLVRALLGRGPQRRFRSNSGCGLSPERAALPRT